MQNEDENVEPTWECAVVVAAALVSVGGLLGLIARAWVD